MEKDLCSSFGFWLDQFLDLALQKEQKIVKDDKLKEKCGMSGDKITKVYMKEDLAVTLYSMWNLQISMLMFR